MNILMKDQSILVDNQGGQDLLQLFCVIFPFRPNVMRWSSTEAEQCETIVHIGFFDDGFTRLGLSSGSIGLVGHNIAPSGEEELATFAHCCSLK